MKLIYYYLLAINIYAAAIMYCDKKRSIKKAWRVPEMKLFLIALLLGSLGIYCGMYLFRHKTKHMKFVIGIPLIFILQVCLILLYILLK
ncbi:DUF1294 domain-containing protein [Clostridium sp. DJ247]|uniref:DUF1294 domain-containing protein n=1 Tax=Clostridium sp. DJ247 TaxID=2726188 RepID=UPI0016274E06|nr:DUF1294 domain-containing protein [Clostridium sp. DJ247]MBC2581898.1 DUF1294 domain-containing protein [Clostridium sp. DJ247]